MRVPLVLSVAALAACGSSATDPPVAVPDAAVAVGALSAGEIIGFDEVVDSPADGNQSAPAVAWTGSDYLVVWIDDTLGIRMQRVGVDGVVIPGSLATIAPGSNLRDARVVCATGTCAVVWLSFDQANDVKQQLVRIRADGTLLPPVTLPTDLSTVAADAERFVVVWNDAAQLWGRRLGVDPADDGDSFVIARISAPQMPPAVGCAGLTCLVAYQDCLPEMDCTVELARLASDGSVTHLPPTGLDTPSALACAGDSCLLVGRAYPDVSALRLRVDGDGDDDGTRSDLVPVLSMGTQGLGQFDSVDVDADATGFVVSASLVTSGSFTYRLIAKHIALDGTITPPFPAHWDPKLRIPRGQVVAAASIVSPKY